MNLEPIIFTEEEQKKLNQMFEQWMYFDHLKALAKFKDLNEYAKTGGIVFVGDSITEGYPLHEFLESDLPMYNRGISAITSRQILEHLNTHATDLKPSKVFLLIGTNDIERGLTHQETISNIKEIVKTLDAAKINLISIYPINEDDKYKDMAQSRTNKVIQLLNKDIESIAKENKHVSYVNLYGTLLKDNQLNPLYTSDGLHLNMKGYRVVSKILQTLIK